MGGGQDGAIYGSEVFRFQADGSCRVYDISISEDKREVVCQKKAAFTLDRADLIVPHSNAVCFGTEFYAPGDEYPLLYSNIYNNYAGAEDKRIGVCLVYRIERTGSEYRSTLVQMIEIGFTEDASLWRATPEAHGVRPYGNFVIDTERRALWAFVMRNEELGTRYFRFDLPSVREGAVDPLLGIPHVILEARDIREYFDGPYQRFMQGATLYGGKIYSTEGFTASEVNRPGLRVIDLAAHSEEYVDMLSLGFIEEAEFISHLGDVCLYSDARGAIYTVEN